MGETPIITSNENSLYVKAVKKLKFDLLDQKYSTTQSAMDGYAVRVEDEILARQERVKLPVTGVRMNGSLFLRYARHCQFDKFSCLLIDGAGIVNYLSHCFVGVKYIGKLIRC